MTHNFQANKRERERNGSGHLFGDAAVFVEIVQIEGPVQFVGDGASQNDGQTYNKLLRRDKENPAVSKMRKAASERVSQ